MRVCPKFARLFAFSAVVVCGSFNVARADHADMLIAQDPSGKLVTGIADFDNSQWVVGARSFEGELPAVALVDDPSGIDFEADPGFNARSQADLDADNPPTGSYLALPALADVNFAIVPLAIGGNAANLFYWNGLGAVNFLPAVGVTLTMTVGSFSAAADGANSVVPGFDLETTDSAGVIHRHPDYVLDDGIAGSYAPDGVYLLPLVAKMNGLADSDPFTITFAAGEVNPDVHAAAAAWVEAHVVPEPSAFVLAAWPLLVLAAAYRKLHAARRVPGSERSDGPVRRHVMGTGNHFDTTYRQRDLTQTH
jgi:hypothetical protein